MYIAPNFLLKDNGVLFSDSGDVVRDSRKDLIHWNTFNRNNSSNTGIVKMTQNEGIAEGLVGHSGHQK